MTMKLSPSTTPGGRRIVRSEANGVIDEADAKNFREQFGPGGVYAGVPLLGVVPKDVSFTSQSRRIFAEPIPGMSDSALVVTSAASRVMLNFVIEASQAMGHTTNNTMFFPTVEAAEAWLDRPAGA